MKKQISVTFDNELIINLHMQQAEMIVANGKYVSLNSIISDILKEKFK